MAAGGIGYYLYKAGKSIKGAICLRTHQLTGHHRRRPESCGEEVRRYSFATAMITQRPRH